MSTLALELPRAPYNYARPELPFFYLEQGVANLDNTPSFNLVSDLGATLGRVLFYDKALSQNRTLAMVAFLRTLSDEEMARDPKFSDPFRGR